MYLKLRDLSLNLGEVIAVFKRFCEKKKSYFPKSTRNVEFCVINTVPFCPLLLTLFTLNIAVILVSTRQLIPSALLIRSHSLWIVLAHLCQHHQ